MNVVYKPDLNEILERRKQAYLKDWPIDKQLEAITEAYSGKTDKFDNLLKDIAAIKRLYPKE